MDLYNWEYESRMNVSKSKNRLMEKHMKGKSKAGDLVSISGVERRPRVCVHCIGLA